MQTGSFVIAALTALVQYYDYHLFGFLAVKISKYLVPKSDPVVQLMSAYFIMSMSVFAKPVTAMILGRIGDIYGRSATLMISLVGTAIASFIIAVTPTYEQIGIFSSAILLVTRMAVCSFTSAGTDGIRLYVYEKISKTKKCLGNGFITGATLSGSFLASFSAWFFTLEIFPEYSWRFSFALGAFLGVLMILARYFIKTQNEENYTKRESKYHEYKNTSIFTIIKNYHLIFLLCIGLAGGIGASYQFNIIFFGTYNFEVLKIANPSAMQFYTSLSIILYIAFSIIGGLTADFFGPRYVASIAIILLVIISSVNSWMIANNKTIISLYFLSNICLPFITMPSLTILKQSIPLVVRYRIFSLSHALGSMCISGPTALVATFLYHKTKITWLPMVYFVTILLMMFIVINILCHRFNSDKIT